MKNAISLQGRLGKDPELTEKQSQKGPFKVTTFSLAVDRDFGDETDWFPCEIVGNSAVVFEKYVHKGDMVIVDGRMESFKPKNDPERKAWSVKVSRFWFCNSKSSEHGKNQTSTSEPAPDGFESIDEDVPF